MHGPRAVGVTWGDPHSAFTYSGVPWHLFAELEGRSVLVGRASAKLVRATDVTRGMLDIPRSLRARRPRRNAVWRYLPQNIELLTDRFARVQARLPAHDAVLQFGVAGIPTHGALVAHVEIPIATAAGSPQFARSFGFDQLDEKTLSDAVDGEQEFLEACSIVWTNSPWTAAQLVAQGCPANKVSWYPPGCGATDPGIVDRQWDRCSVLFIGKEWAHKGGPELVEAFRLLRRHRPDARLTIVGCTPDVASEPGVAVVGYLHKDNPADRMALDRALRDATVFCLPSLWESTGLVFMEAALYGLPVIMVRGQGREDLFPADSMLALADRNPAGLAAALVELTDDPQRMLAMGAIGRSHVLTHYMWPTVAGHVAELIETSLGSR